MKKIALYVDSISSCSFSHSLPFVNALITLHVFEVIEPKKEGRGDMLARS